MGATKIQSGYGSGRRSYGKYGQYGGRKTGKMRNNGGFGQPTVSFESIDQSEWDRIFTDGYKPSWEKNE